MQSQDLVLEIRSKFTILHCQIDNVIQGIHTAHFSFTIQTQTEWSVGPGWPNVSKFFSNLP
jgi:hypothetical protein